MSPKADLLDHPCMFKMGEMFSGAAGKDLLPQRPTYGAQVMVQSEEERLLRKQVSTGVP